MNKANVARRLRLFFVDSIVIGAMYLIAWMLYMFVSKSPLHTFSQYPLLLVWLIAVAALYGVIFYLLRVNTIVWRYAESRDLLRLFIVSCVAGLISWIVLFLLHFIMMPTVFYSMALIGSALLLVLSKVLYLTMLHRRGMNNSKSAAKRLLIVGAGSAGSKMAAEIYEEYCAGYSLVGFVDDDPEKQHAVIRGCRVLGTTKQIEDVCREYNVEVIFIAIPSATAEGLARILDECLKTECTVKTLPFFAQLGDRINITQAVRDIKPEELLGREPIKIADEDILSFVSGKTIVVTGGGGSIGSELCRQIAAHAPKRLIIIDIYENNAYDIQQELISKYGKSLDLMVYIFSVCDRYKLNTIFAEEKPDIVIHAAAHKHVPLMETVPDEAVKNNVFGTLNTALVARSNKVSKFVLISTDKAVNPTNIMGATKRVCEMIIQYVNSISTDTTFAAVRFGNVLGSNGSVIPLFKDQIERRVDVTVTHPDIIRFFMTIPEASQLVLTASAMARGGEIFVLDMGEPVKIDDMARKMIHLAGLTIGKDINIRYTGLRPGEKLYEELLMSEEGLQKTLNEKIFIGEPIPMDYVLFKQEVDDLCSMVEQADVTNEAVEAGLMKIVPTFHRAVPQPLPEAGEPVETEEKACV